MLVSRKLRGGLRVGEIKFYLSVILLHMIPSRSSTA